MTLSTNLPDSGLRYVTDPAQHDRALLPADRLGAELREHLRALTVRQEDPVSLQIQIQIQIQIQTMQQAILTVQCSRLLTTFERHEIDDSAFLRVQSLLDTTEAKLSSTVTSCVNRPIVEP
ncbi:hypothetical protein ACFVKB_45830 [Rhodococcus sp. NPDC127530]|uniref:hypothetical protein n=1 Tax=unclassified Rhodococcus (in: high G+C Gram-positive bacteria) TaxID=192944 RepID=UPI00363FE6CA